MSNRTAACPTRDVGVGRAPPLTRTPLLRSRFQGQGVARGRTQRPHFRRRQAFRNTAS
jgi:hypothetical protein